VQPLSQPKIKDVKEVVEENNRQREEIRGLQKTSEVTFMNMETVTDQIVSVERELSNKNYY